MSDETINCGNPREVYTYQRTCELRWYAKQEYCVSENLLFTGLCVTKTLQQAWICIETGEYKWEDIPCVAGEESKP